MANRNWLSAASGPRPLAGEQLKDARWTSDANRLFESSWYLEQYPDVATTGLSPLEHYLKAGAAAGYDPHPLFDTSWYLDRYPDVAAGEINALEHYLRFGLAERRSPHPLFDAGWYLKEYPDALASGLTPVEHYLIFGTKAGYDPHPLFDTSWYLEHYPTVAAAGINPLVDYLKAGAWEGRDPNPNFETARYITEHPNIVAACKNPLIHYLESGLLQPRESTRRRIQIFRREALGDVLLVTPILKAFRAKHSGDEIVVTTLYPEIFEDNPYIDHVVKSPVPVAGFDKTLILQYEMRPDEHIVDAYAHSAQVLVSDRTPEIYLRQEERVAAEQLLRSSGIRLYEPFCVMQITTGWSVRDWPVSRFKTVAEAIEGDGLRVVILGATAEPPIDFGVDLRGRTSVRAAAAIIEKCALMVTVDSALMHMGYAFRRPVIALFGCTDPEKRVPDWGLPTALYSDVICRGCHHRQRPIPALTAPLCPWDTVQCMDQLSAHLVNTTIKAAMARASVPLVSIIIPHYFKYDLLQACLSSIFRYGAQSVFEVVVVANGSPAENIEQLRAWRPNVRIVTLEPNQGFSKACNAGAKAARGKYLIFLNDDTTVTPGWLDEMIDFIESNPEVGIAGPKLLYPENNGIQHCGTVFNEKGYGDHIYRHLPGSFVAANRPRYYRALTGACLLIERELFLGVGQFDTSYHGTGGCEDTDLCFKVLERGRMVAYCPSSIVYHHEGVTRGLRDEHHPEDVYNRSILRDRWSKYLAPDISDYCLLAEIEAGEEETWRWLRDVPTDIIARYDSRDNRAVGRPPFRLQIGSGTDPQMGYLHIDAAPDALGVDIVQDPLKQLPFREGSVVEILAKHTIELISPRDLLQVLAEFHRVLAKGGKVQIRTPSLQNIVADYLHAANGALSSSRAAALLKLDENNPVIRTKTGSLNDKHFPTDLREVCVCGESLAALCRAIGFSEAHLNAVGEESWVVALR